MIVALTIFAIIAAGVGSAFVSGIRIWGKAKNSDIAKANLFLTLEALDKELRQTVKVPYIVFEGGPDRFSFPSLKDDSILKLTYRFDPAEHAINCRKTQLKDLPDEKDDEGFVEKLKLEELAFSYLRFDATKKFSEEAEWKKEWGIPFAVKLKGKFRDEEFTKTVFIPIAP